MDLPLVCSTLSCRQSVNIDYAEIKTSLFHDKVVVESMVQYLKNRTNAVDTFIVDTLFPGCDDNSKKYIVNTVMIIFGYFIRCHCDENDKFQRMAKVYSHIHILQSVVKKLTRDSVFLDRVRTFMKCVIHVSENDAMSKNANKELMIDFILEHCVRMFNAFMDLSVCGDQRLECCIFCDLPWIANKGDWLFRRNMLNCYCCNIMPISTLFAFVESDQSEYGTWAQWMLAKICVIVYLSNQHCYSVLNLCTNWVTFEGWNKSMIWSPSACALMRTTVCNLLTKRVGFTLADAEHIFDYGVQHVLHTYTMNSFVQDGNTFCVFCTRYYSCPLCS